jgi:GNAT superfamily N-acetyltransferase
MKLVPYDDLPESSDPDRALVQLAAFGGFFDRRRIELWRRRASVFADYLGVFAVDRSAVVGQTFVQRIPFTFPHGTETVSGIAGVATRLDHARTGVARRVLEEVHRREREAGIGYSMLWTNRSWGAHRLYEKLGYRDVYAPPWAVRVPGTRRPSTRPKAVRPGHRSDLEAIEHLHRRYAEGRWGFARRPPNFMRVSVAAGDLRPREETLVALNDGRLSGYAVVDSNQYRVICGELVSSSSAVRARLASAIEARARHRPVAFRDATVEDMRARLRRRGYSIATAGWFSLMAMEYGRERSGAHLKRELGTNDPRFVCLDGDHF